MTRLEKGTLYNEDMRGITTSSPVFEHLIQHNLTYVDKTKYIHSLVSSTQSSFYFVSRPRRWGKSLFCYTLESLFKGARDLFKGLYIYDKYDFKPYPVLHFDFNNLDLISSSDAVKWLKGKLILAANEVGIDLNDSYSPSMMFEMLIEKLYREKGEVVIIIDEYDSPVVSAALNKPELADDIRSLFNSFYATVKNKISRIRFFFITGVVRLSNLSIFSALNNLKDLSMDPSFALAFGYTDEELDEYFGEGIDEYLAGTAKNKTSRDELREKIRNFYDGYRFSPASETKVYNPFSIGNFFAENCRFDTYWDDTSSSKFAVTLANNLDLSQFMNTEIALTTADFKSFDISEINKETLKRNAIAALLYYSGYLTISEKSNTEKIYLGFPNNEVSSTFTISLMRRYSKDSTIAGLLIVDAREAARNGDTAALIKSLNDYYDQVTSALVSNRYEQPYQLIMHMFFIAAGCRAVAELPTKLGRIDNSMEIGNHIYLFELKVDQNAETALNQIKEKEYDKLFATQLKQGKILHNVGISISSEKRGIVEYKEEILSLK